MKARFKRILLVIPPGVEQGGYTPSPLGLLYLASYLRKKDSGITLAVIDGALEGERALVAKLNKFRPDLVGVSVMTPGRHQALRIARLVKRMFSYRCKVVFGGIHPTLMWEQMMEHYPEVDYIVRGEGEMTLSELVAGKPLAEIDGLVWRDKQEPVKNKDRALIVNLDDLPFPAWDLIAPLKYPPRGKGFFKGINLETEVRFSLIFSRGCMGACTFCSSWRVWKGYRYRSGRNVAEEVEFLIQRYGAQHFCFQDDTLTGNREEIINFCREITKRRIKIAIVGVTRVDLVDKELLIWMRKAGFYELAYGIESGSPRMLAKINKKTDLQDVKKAAFLTQKAEIKISALMMYGLPEETEEDRRLTNKLLEEIKPDGTGTLGEVWIFPGTVLYYQAQKAGLLDDRFWLGGRPYYIYRGGIGSDPINWKLKTRDFLKFYFSGTFLDKLRIRLLLLKRRFGANAR